MIANAIAKEQLSDSPWVNGRPKHYSRNKMASPLRKSYVLHKLVRRVPTLGDKIAYTLTISTHEALVPSFSLLGQSIAE